MDGSWILTLLFEMHLVLGREGTKVTGSRIGQEARGQKLGGQIQLTCSESGPCASGCSYETLESGGLLVDCSFLNLTAIPRNLPINTEQLLLSSNYIRRIEGQAFWECREWLKYLDLADNYITDVDKKAFQGLLRLETLSLQRNIAFQTASSFPVETFDELPQLTTLVLHKFYPVFDTTLSLDMERVLGNLTNLKGLSLTSLSNGPFEYLSAQIHLEKLYISSYQIPPFLYHFFYFTNETFRALSKAPIKSLFLRSVRDTEAMTFSYFTQLKHLDLSYSNFLNATQVSKAWFGLRYTNISTLTLVSIFSDFTELDESFFIDLGRTRLKTLFLDSNWLTYVGDIAWFQIYLPYLEHLSLENNRLDSLHYFLGDLNSLTALRFISVNNQVNLDRTEETFNLAKCDDAVLPGIYRNTDNCFNENNQISFPTPLNEILVVRLPNSLQEIYIESANAILTRYSWQSFSIELSQNIQYISLARSGLSKVNFKLVQKRGMVPQHKITLDLSKNSCRSLSDICASHVGSIIRSLRLGENRLGELMDEDVRGSTFENCSELTELDLSFNGIKTLHREVFRSQSRIEMLNLGNNNLQSFGFTIAHMANLTHLDLTSNLLRHLSQDNIAELNVLASNHNISVALAGNPLTCSCDSLHFLNWVIKTKVSLVQWQTWSCLHRREFVSFDKLETAIVPQLQVDCSSKTWLIASAVTLAVLLLFMIICVVLYRHRFEVRYLLLKLVIRRKQYEAEIEQEQYTYDAFVAFDMADVDWVSNELLPQLEGEEGDGGFRLCVHHRDFTGGVPIVENIADAILSSRKVILVLTRHFLASSWCQFELETTQVRAFEEGKDLLIPLLLEDLPPANVSKTLRTLLRRNTYITWPEHRQEIDNFWEALRRALASRSERLIRCQCGKNINAGAYPI